MRRRRLIATRVLVALALLAPAAAAARPASSTRPAIHAAEVRADALALRVRFEGGGPVRLTRVTAAAGGRLHVIAPSAVGVRPCGPDARVALVLAADADGRVPIDDVRAAVETALASLPAAQVSTWVVGRDGAFAAPQHPTAAATALALPEQPASRGALELAFRAVDAQLGREPGQRRIALVVTTGSADTGALADPARQLVEGDSGVELYELVLGARSRGSSDPLGAYAAVGRAGDPREAGELVGAELDRCHLVDIPLARLPGGAVELTLAAGGAPDAALRRTITLPARAVGAGASWWFWPLTAGGGALLIVAAMIWRGGRARPVRRRAGGRDGGEVQVRATIAPLGNLRPGLRTQGKTLALDPLKVEAGGATQPFPTPPGFAGWLVQYRHGQPVATFVLQPVGVTTIGRDPSLSLCIDDPTVSKLHARILVKTDRFVIEDAGSSNGVRVDGEPVVGERVLVDGMQLELGRARLRFKCTP